VKFAQRVLLVLVCAVLPGTMSGVVQARQGGSRYFPETGHNVAGEFLEYYDSIPDASLVFGLPITEAFVTRHPRDMTVQYFQRIRFELHPSQPAGKRVQLTPLGELLYKSGTESVNVYTPGACRRFSSGFSVCYNFLSFFDAHGGLERFWKTHFRIRIP